jgi:alpha-D-ribose 1-methylphosphonate 5-triphosphate synthase subunit PhnG
MPETHDSPIESAPPLKARLQKVVESASAEEASAMLDRLWAAGGFEVKRRPQNGLAMIAVLDPFETPFYLGEILMTTAEVTLEGRLGHGAVSGDAPEKALLLAAVDVAERCGRTAEFRGLEEFIAGLARVHAEQTILSARIAAATEVRFESMKKETVDFGSLGG